MKIRFITSQPFVRIEGNNFWIRIWKDCTELHAIGAFTGTEGINAVPDPSLIFIGEFTSAGNAEIAWAAGFGVPLHLQKIAQALVDGKQAIFLPT